MCTQEGGLGGKTVARRQIRFIQVDPPIEGLLVGLSCVTNVPVCLELHFNKLGTK